MAGDGDPDDEALARADAALAALTADYLRWVQADVAALGAALAALRDAAPGQWAACAGQVAAIAHDIKGQGATFGYPLMTRLGHAVCELLRDACAADEALLTQLDLLVSAMAEVVSSRLDGDGGTPGRDLVSRLAPQMAGLWVEG